MDNQKSLKRYTKNTVDKLSIHDCVKSVPLRMIKSDDFDIMIKMIVRELDKLVDVFNWSPAPNWKLSFVDMILDKYSYESLEDVLMCLRDGRIGKYKKPFGVLDPVTFGEWMAAHLEKKYEIIESEKRKLKPEFNDVQEFKSRQEYYEFVRIGLINQAKIIQAKRDFEKKEEAYRNFKARYLNKKKNESI